MTVFVAVIIAFSGGGDSPSAVATISVPINENITTVTPKKIELIPLGRNPPLSRRFDVPGDSTPGMKPHIIAPPRIKNRPKLTTLIKENQYSNSPKDLTENMLVK